ncbi:secretion protein HlyD [Edwardsiella ictaluri]|uniref:Auxiliary transport protein, membrane fusion protein (MFP) family n=2 Tax=Edwardsiella ictaluri TaxID=67780 RepID=C5BFZ7_EDWI9|nr:secretion protein HlyD [Edwardsiella ictaluri]ACR69791.1 auxiliary transport protein, membrane fusion protein (MFP) family [Edwardsiella ictaluri 93-146]ARD38853.1 secretion protein HlyD [Edwardsiella ictaluri]AVZ83256.1 secretion protein HlyD [Edwardsiella ictaluri]EKS7761868.1 secretion protein HlyD [Edwardsiella ictaluri]EKS7768678.1 secretion protein HlyD [Edwardsiella ictaluri]
MNKRRITGVVIGVVLIALACAGYDYYRSQQDQPLTLYGNVDIRTVDLGFRVSGRLASLSVDEGAAVKPGMLLGRLDDAPYVNALNEARANTAAAQANLALLQAGYRSEEIAQAQAAVAQADANYRYAQSFLDRQQGLWASRAVSANELDNARTNRNQASAQLQQARDKLAQYQAGNRPQQIEQAQAQLQQAQAAQAQAELNLHDTALLAPSAGTVMTRAVEPGTMLAAGNTVFSVALTRPVWVRAYVDETHLNQAIPGTPIDLYIDGRRQPYHGTIGFVSPTAEFTPKTVETPELRTALVYRLRVIVNDADDALRQGMPITLRFAPAQR